MTTAAIDIDALNELFDNQKKVDDIFNSMFEDDSFLSDPVLTSQDLIFEVSVQKRGQDFSFEEDLLFCNDDLTSDHKNSSMLRFVIPVLLEIGLLYYAVMYFN